MNIDNLIKTLNEDVLKNLTVSNTEDIKEKSWFFGVGFREDEEHQVVLWKIRNRCKNRFAPKETEVCYLAKDLFRIEDEIELVTIKKVIIRRQIRLLNFDLNGPIKEINNIFTDVKYLLKGSRTKENYKASCILADYILEKGFEGIYYSPYPDPKNQNNSLLEQANREAQKISPHFNLYNAYGPRYDPMLVVFKTEATENMLKLHEC